MVTTAVAAIIAAVFASLGAIVGTMSTGLWARYIDKRNRRRHEKDVVRKYHDPLLRACQRLQTRILHLCNGNLPVVSDVNSTNMYEPAEDNYITTLFSFGRYFAWALALENDVRSIHHEASLEDKQVLGILYKIQRVLDEDCGRLPFQVHIFAQIAIGEVMTTKDSVGTLIGCQDFNVFLNKWFSSSTPTDNSTEVKFSTWFDQICRGIILLARTDTDNPIIAVRSHRLREVQHLLISLMEVLDPEQLRTHDQARSRIHIEYECSCQSPDCPHSIKPLPSITSMTSFVPRPPSPGPDSDPSVASGSGLPLLRSSSSLNSFQHDGGSPVPPPHPPPIPPINGGSHDSPPQSGGSSVASRFFYRRNASASPREMSEKDPLHPPRNFSLKPTPPSLPV